MTNRGPELPANPNGSKNPRKELAETLEGKTMSRIERMSEGQAFTTSDTTMETKSPSQSGSVCTKTQWQPAKRG